MVAQPVQLDALLSVMHIRCRNFDLLEWRARQAAGLAAPKG